MTPLFRPILAAFPQSNQRPDDLIALTLRTTAIVVLLCIALSAGAAPQDGSARPQLSPFELDYQVFRNGREVGEATLTLKHMGGDRWLFETDVRATRGLASLASFSSNDRSEFELREGGMRSLDYQGAQSSLGRSRERKLAFDWQSAELIESGRRQGRWPLSGMVVDRHLSLLALTLDMRADSRSEQPRSFDIAWSGGVETMEFALQGGHMTEVAAGQFETVRAERVRESSRRQTLSWHAAELDQLPVRIEHRDSGGEVIEMRLAKLPQR